MMKAGMAMEKAPHNRLEESKVTEASHIPPLEMEPPRCAPTGVSSTSSGRRRRRPPIIHQRRWYHGIEDEGDDGDDEEMMDEEWKTRIEEVIGRGSAKAKEKGLPR